MLVTGSIVPCKCIVPFLVVFFVQAGRAKESFVFGRSICRANTDPPVTKSRLWAFFAGCTSRSGLDGGRPDEKNFIFLTIYLLNPNNRENIHRLFGSVIAIDRAWSN
jgi:hypothetical protein